MPTLSSANATTHLASDYIGFCIEAKPGIFAVETQALRKHNRSCEYIDDAVFMAQGKENVFTIKNARCLTSGRVDTTRRGASGLSERAQECRHRVNFFFG